jgi:hypothetical protein
MICCWKVMCVKVFRCEVSFVGWVNILNKLLDS